MSEHLSGLSLTRTGETMEALNCQQGLGTTRANPILYPWQQAGGYLGCTPYVQYCYCSVPRNDLNAFEIVIEQLSTDDEPLLNYGAKLRLLMADPIKGHDLREAVQQLKLALQEGIKIWHK